MEVKIILRALFLKPQTLVRSSCPTARGPKEWKTRLLGIAPEVLTYIKTEGVQDYHRKCMWKYSIMCVYVLEEEVRKEERREPIPDLAWLQSLNLFTEQISAKSSTKKSQMPFESLGTMLRTSRTSHGISSTPAPPHTSFLFPHIQDLRAYFYARLRWRMDLGLNFPPSPTPKLPIVFLDFVLPGGVKRDLIPLAWFVIPLFLLVKIKWRERTLIPFKNHTLFPLSTLSSLPALPHDDDNIEYWRIWFEHWSREGPSPS